MSEEPFQDKDPGRSVGHGTFVTLGYNGELGNRSHKTPGNKISNCTSMKFDFFMGQQCLHPIVFKTNLCPNRGQKITDAEELMEVVATQRPSLSTKSPSERQMGGCHQGRKPSSRAE